MLDAAVDQHRRRLSQLQHGEAVVALTDTERNGFSGKPFFLFGFLEITAFPGLAGQYAAHFAVDVDTGDLAKAQRFHEIMHRVHADLIGQRVEINVAGFDNRTVHVHDAAAFVFRTAKTATAKHEKTWIVDQCGMRACTCLQGCHGHERLVGGPWRVSAAQSPV